jgi:hypothetical protein
MSILWDRGGKLQHYRISGEKGHMPSSARVALITGCGKPIGIGNSTARALGRHNRRFRCTAGRRRQ